jgi:hypothetical protein
MRLLVLIILILLVQETFSQGKIEKVLTYKYGCHGSCNFSYSDTCELKRDSVIEEIIVTKINSDYFINGRKISHHIADSLNIFLKNEILFIKKLVHDTENEKNYQFVPPKPQCYQFEEYELFTEKPSLRYLIIDLDKNENGTYLLSTEAQTLLKLKQLIK